MKNLKTFVILSLIALTVFVGLQYKSPKLSERSFIVGVAIDGDGDMYTLTAEIISPSSKAGGGSPDEDSRKIISGEGRDIAACVKEIYDQTGKLPSFGHCNLIILGDSLKGRDISQELDCFIKSPAMSDGAALVFADGDAKELIATSTPLSKFSSLAIGELLSAKEQKFGEAVLTISAFRRATLSRSKTVVLPVVTREEIKTAAKESGGEAGEAGGKSSAPEVYYDTAKKYALKRGVYAAEFTKEEQAGYELMCKDTKNTVVTIDGTAYALSNKKVKQNLEIIGDILQVVYEITATLEPSSLEESKLLGVAEQPPSDEARRAAAIEIKRLTSGAFQNFAAQNIDILSLSNYAYAKYGKRWQSYEEGFLRNVEFLVNVKIK